MDRPPSLPECCAWFLADFVGAGPAAVFPAWGGRPLLPACSAPPGRPLAVEIWPLPGGALVVVGPPGTGPPPAPGPAAAARLAPAAWAGAPFPGPRFRAAASPEEGLLLAAEELAGAELDFEPFIFEFACFMGLHGRRRLVLGREGPPCVLEGLGAALDLLDGEPPFAQHSRSYAPGLRRFRRRWPSAARGAWVGAVVRAALARPAPA